MQVKSFVNRSGQGGTGIPQQHGCKDMPGKSLQGEVSPIHEATLADNFETASVMAFGNQKGKPV